MSSSLIKYFIKKQQVVFYLFFASVWFAIFLAQLNLYPKNITNDLSLYQLPWWKYLSTHGFHGIATINSEVYSQIGDQRYYADYTSVWYFIIVVITKLGVHPNVASVAAAIKCIGAGFTIMSSVVTFLIVKYFQVNKSEKQWNAVFAAMLILFIPPFFGDMLKTNLPDSAYIALVLLSLLMFLKEKYGFSWFIFGVAIYFKAMALYIAPLYIFLYLFNLKNTSIIEKLAPLFSFLGLISASLPGYFAGLTLFESAFGTLLERTSSTGGAENGFLSIFDGKDQFVNFPVISQNNLGHFQIISILLMFSYFCLVIFLMFQTKSEVGLKISLLDLTIISPLIFWFFLPGQHENYFSISAVFSFLVFFIAPTKKYFILMGILNFLVWESYHFVPKLLFNPYLFIIIMFYLTWEIIKRSELHMTEQLIS
ncbi:hypothetical protein D0501_07600 [Leuconostoc holzapfelii]|uniref:Glycosyltransferase RgtA/B/C/D-like domain-containing protein n=1 Tax=Leuconostoc holzapfelii TaxID=434464 RepID=A0ABT2NX36_9LACO|nr:hypothetical protein [Leuconostoc holzapfelii]MCT8389930.1 hypothetical protein [Leuconostoc holzapfelii]